MYQLTGAGARAVMVAAQGLHERPGRPADKQDVRQAIRRMGALQIDTIHVVARSPYLVLWSRLGDYEPRWLDELLSEGALFEYWSHAACLLPIEDYPLYRRLMLDRRKGYSSSPAWLAAHAADVEQLLEHVRARDGGVRAADFQRSGGRSQGWWDWKHEKLILEHLHNIGVLMTARRHNFQRVYDLRERVHPGWDDRDAPPYEHVAAALGLQAVRALGICTARWLPDYFRLRRCRPEALLASLEAGGELARAQVTDWNDQEVWFHRDHLPLVEAAVAGALEPRHTTLLSPFDPLVWDRSRTKTVFDFDYRLESYTPAARRAYGYFSLPILHRGELVGRLDPKVYRSERRFEVRALHLEPRVAVTADLVAGVAGALRACARWHKATAITVSWANRPGLAAEIEQALQ